MWGVRDCPLDHVQSAGNAAGTGARIALLNAGARAEITRHDLWDMPVLFVLLLLVWQSVVYSGR